MPLTGDPSNFQDPLENYEEQTYSDELERALVEETVAAIQSAPFDCISPDTTIEDAVKKLAASDVACLLVEEEGDLVGLFTDREVLDKLAVEYESVKNMPVRMVMTADPVFVYSTDTPAAVLHVMAVSGHRHVPVIARDGNLLGIASPQRVVGFLQQYF